jgi:hypothetical protein
MRLTVPLGLLTLCLFNAGAQVQAPPIKQGRTPIKVETFPAVPVIHPPVTDRASSSLVAEMMPFVAPLVVETPEITSTIVLANASSEATTATIRLISVDGKKSKVHRITLQPHEKKEFPISSPPDSTDPNERWGSVTVDQDPHSTGVVVAGQVIVTDQRASTPAYIDEELAMPEMEGSTSLSAVADQSEGPPMVGITNISSVLQHVLITCIRDGKSPMASRIEIAAHATAITKVCSNPSPSTLSDYISSIEEGNAQGVYGIKLDGDGAPGSFAAFALAPHHRGHDLVFSSVPFYDPEMIHSSDVVFAGVPIGGQETLPAGVYIPRLSLANFSDSPLKFSVKLADTLTSPAKDSEGNTQPPILNMIHAGIIPPHQTGEYMFSGQEAQSGLLHSVVVTTEAKPGTYQAKLVSRSTGILYQVELLAKETLEMNNAGVHPWTVQGDTESHIVLFNHSKGDKKVGIFISSGSTTVWDRELLLAPSETREVSINQLQRDQVPDDHGRRMPISAKDGVADWRTPESGDVTGRLMVTSHDRAMARNFSCGTYYGACQLVFSTLFSDISVGSSLAMYDATVNYCNFNPNAPTRCVNGSPTSGTSYLSWTVGATNIIALNASTEQGKQSPILKGVSAGSGYANVEGYAGSCQVTGGGTPKVTPTVSISGPTTMALTGLIQLTATGNPAGGTYSWSVQNSDVLVLSATSGATVNVSAKAVGTSTVTVTYTLNGSPATASQTITVQACPTTLTRSNSIPEPLAPLVPVTLSGVGIIAQMQVGPSSVDWEFTPITETVTAGANSCPASVGPCAGNSTFSVGSDDDGSTMVDTIPTPATTNVFYDNHTVTSPSNLLAAAGKTSCSFTCNQTYSCGGKQLGSAYSITYSLTQGTVGSTAVTNVTATKTP